MKDKFSKVKYIKPSSVHGEGSVKKGTVGKVLKLIDNPQTAKLIVDFENVGEVVVPKSAVEFID